MKAFSLFFVILCAMAAGAFAGETPSPAGARVYIANLKDGDLVRSPFKIKFGLEKMTVAPAGIEKENTGHHHLIIDAKLPSMDEAIPDDANYRHFGKGQTETELTLSPGKHTLQLLMGDWSHIPHHPPVYSKPITVIVQ